MGDKMNLHTHTCEADGQWRYIFIDFSVVKRKGLSGICISSTFTGKRGGDGGVEGLAYCKWNIKIEFRVPRCRP